MADKITPAMIADVKHDAYVQSHKSGTGEHVIQKGGNTFVVTTSEHGAVLTDIQTDHIRVSKK